MALSVYNVFDKSWASEAIICSVVMYSIWYVPNKKLRDRLDDAHDTRSMFSAIHIVKH